MRKTTVFWVLLYNNFIYKSIFHFKMFNINVLIFRDKNSYLKSDFKIPCISHPLGEDHKKWYLKQCSCEASEQWVFIVIDESRRLAIKAVKTQLALEGKQGRCPPTIRVWKRDAGCSEAGTCSLIHIPAPDWPLISRRISFNAPAGAQQ